MSKTLDTQKSLDELIIDPNVVTLSIKINTKTGNIQCDISKNNIFTPMQLADVATQIACQYVRQGIVAEVEYQKVIHTLEVQLKGFERVNESRGMGR